MKEKPPEPAATRAMSVALPCSHEDQIVDGVAPSGAGCVECLQSGDSWVQLRMCLTCGHVGCCDSSKNQHASAHFRASQHPVIRSHQPGETWRWCYIDETYLDV
jgi:uncharacterized UBP type Zn finger protein